MQMDCFSDSSCYHFYWEERSSAENKDHGGGRLNKWKMKKISRKAGKQMDQVNVTGLPGNANKTSSLVIMILE